MAAASTVSAMPSKRHISNTTASSSDFDTLIDKLNSTGSDADFDAVIDKLNSTGTITDSSSTNITTSNGNEWIVIFDPDHPLPPNVTAVLATLDMTPGHPRITHVFNNTAFAGFTGDFGDGHIKTLHTLAQDASSQVKFVEQSVQISSYRTQQRTGSPWGLQAISSSQPVTGDISQRDFTYTYDGNQLGDGVDIYVVDTGVNTAHEAFGGRARMGFSYLGASDLNANCDQDGHGTHVAGTSAANTYGVASNANIIGVRVLGADGSGASSDTIKGMDYVISNHNARKTNSGFVGSIINMSWGLGSRSPSVEAVINAATSVGVHVSAASGNQGTDACNQAPSATGGTGGNSVVVGSIGSSDDISSFSNTGTCVDVYAPGENVMSTWINTTTGTNILSGTSMATPRKYS
jgi:cerevisin